MSPEERQLIVDLPQIEPVLEEWHYVLGETTPHDLEQAGAVEILEEGEDLRAVPSEGFEQRPAQMQIDRDPVLDVHPQKREEARRMRAGAAEPQDVRDSLAIAVAIRDDILVRVVDDRQRGPLSLGRRSHVCRGSHVYSVAHESICSLPGT